MRLYLNRIYMPDNYFSFFRLWLAPGILVLLMLASCGQKGNISDHPAAGEKWVGSVEFDTPEMGNFFDDDQKIEVLATGFDWAEGPVWDEEHHMLLFSDIPKNRIYKWTEEKGIQVYLDKAGYTGNTKRGGEMGSNGLALDRRDNLILCQHGDRAISMMAAEITNPKAEYIHLTDNYKQLKYNSPNDLYMDAESNIYFTDPPYGLENGMNDSLKEMDYQGVYFMSRTGKVELLTKSISRPNGISLIQDEKSLIVANSDPEDPKWYRFDRDSLGRFWIKSVFHDASAEFKNNDNQGLPDGLKWHPDGYLFATGPGGVWVMDGNGKLIGKILTGRTTANCAFDFNLGYLYMTADDALLRIKLKNGDEKEM